jgi:hypothetical protein
MLSNLLKFNAVISNVSNLSNNQLLECAYNILWDYTTGCVKSTTTTNNYIVGMYNNNNNVDQQTLNMLNTIRYSNFNNFNNFNNYNDINYNEILLVYKSNIFKILDYAQEVYEDILSMYDYMVRGKEYCQKDYMSVKNLPYLNSLYNNFYNNQIYSYENTLPVSNIISLDPTYISITQYVDNFISYFENNKLGKVKNTIYLNDEEAFVFCITNNNLQFSTYEDYLYYYINIYNPSAVSLSNFWYVNGYNTTGYWTYAINQVTTFINNFIFSVGKNGSPDRIPAYWNIANINVNSYNEIKKYSNGGLYPYTGPPYADGYVYYFYNDAAKTSLNSKVYLTLETYKGKTGGVGLPIVYYST